MDPIKGIGAVFLTTHNYGKTVKLLQSVGYELDFATDHGSGQFRSASGPYLFVAEIPADEMPGTQLMLDVAADEPLDLDPIVEVVTPFAPTHYGTTEMTVRDPDGRVWSLQAPGEAATTP